MDTQNVKAVARRVHGRICRKLAELGRSKVEAYFLLRSFKRSRLYRLLEVPMCERHARRVCAPRRFPTWEDYLSSLGGWGISFGYFAELERLESRFGAAFVRLCAAGLPVDVRRFLLRARRRERVEAGVCDVLARPGRDSEKIEVIRNLAAVWESEEESEPTGWGSPRERASRYRRHARQWETKLGELAEQLCRVPLEVRAGQVYGELARAWREVFEQHLDIGERLARACVAEELGLAHWNFLHHVRQAWGGSRRGPQFPGVPPVLPRREVEAA